ncbi:unnamed protein product [Cuscuta epithymum]|uniref:Reverse transcriptase zinc-binding domain-containing protein n=1 Tax=Cuscuta epithymum TaxID=186058 RepID=A0AAV0GB52_9ASTE|nr:unnamed protein product [Cuscuta epithymum]
MYTVRSAHRAIVADRQRNEAASNNNPSSSLGSEEELWKNLWKLMVTPKVRVFWWRVLRRILPDYGTLSRRHIMDISTCGLCKAGTETLLHALVECNHARLFCNAAEEVLFIKLPRLHQATWAADILCNSRFDDKDRPKIISVMHSIWLSQNKWTHSEAGYIPAKAMEYVQELLLSIELPPTHSAPKQPQPECTWHGPPADVVKINSDGALCLDDNIAGSGVVARDCVGFRGAACRSYIGISNPLTIEALALRDAVTFVVNRGFNQVIFEVDCSDLLWHWNQ